MSKVLNTENERHDGHGRPCYICSQPCDVYAGDPSKWPVMLGIVNGYGVLYAHHMGCLALAVEKYVNSK